MVAVSKWYAELAQLESKGSKVDPVGGLAGLARARELHQGQFFTPLGLVAFMWQITGLFAATGRVSIYDSSFGSGRMFAFADPDRHRLLGVEIDEPLANKVLDAVERAGFTRCLEVGSMDEFRLSGSIDVGLINPPFSITIDSPTVEPFESNAYGRFGPKSSALSHVYAVEQALDRCRFVAAVVPRSLADALSHDDPKVSHIGKRLVAIYTLPRKAFADEGADVETSVCVWGESDSTDVDIVSVSKMPDNLDSFEPLFDPSPSYGWGGIPQLNHVQSSTESASITHPYTGDRTVRVVHDGRKLGLRFACGLTQGRVMNAVLLERAGSYVGKGVRQATGIDWKGQGWLDLENYVAQADPAAAFAEFVAKIDAAGGVPVVDPAIPAMLERKVRRSRLMATPFRHEVVVTDGGVSRWLGEQDSVQAVCVEYYGEHGWAYTYQIRPEDQVTLTRDGTFRRDDRLKRRGPRWTCVHKRYYYSFSTDQILKHFAFPDAPTGDGWTAVHEGLAAEFPEQVESTRARSRRLGLDHWCSWSYQFDDLCEVGTKRRAIIAWEMGLGKARLALALCVLGEGRHNLITVESHLLDEMRREIQKLEIADGDWQIIDKPQHVENLRRINLIAYSRLKMAMHKGLRATYADALRRRIHTHVCDEGHILRNDKTDQTRAVLKVSAKTRYLMSGTPVANYPRDVLPLIQWVAGDGVAHQEFGKHQPYMQRKNLRELDTAPRGIDVLREMFVTTEWITNEFADDLRSGAKREIPVIADVPGFRALVAPVIKRRVMREPDVARHISIPEPTYRVTTIEWDRKHLAFYVKVAREFVDWFKKLYDSQRKGVGMIAVIAKMQAVGRAANFPAFGVPGQPKFTHITSKQRHALARLEQWTVEGHKSILLCDSPDTVDWFAGQLREHEPVVFHGKVTIAKRIKALDSRFREGNSPILLATKHCLQTGYNIHQASRVLVYDRTWTPKTEDQACARVLRPQQTKQVEIEFVHLPGSIDEYQAQMVAAKAGAVRAGLDYGDEEKPADGFVHIETILGRFVEDFEERFGVSADELVAEIRA
jgi:predicted RNA methylase